MTTEVFYILHRYLRQLHVPLALRHHAGLHTGTLNIEPEVIFMWAVDPSDVLYWVERTAKWYEVNLNWDIQNGEIGWQHYYADAAVAFRAFAFALRLQGVIPIDRLSLDKGEILLCSCSKAPKTIVKVNDV